MLSDHDVLADGCVAFRTASLRDSTLDQAFQTARRLGFSSLSMLAEVLYADEYGARAVGFEWSEMGESARDELERLAATVGRVAIHAPFADLPLITGSPVVEAEAMRRVLASIEAAGRIGAETVTVHADQVWAGPYEARRLVGYDRIVDKLRRLGEAAEEHGTLLCFENGGNTSADPHQLMAVLDDVDHPAVGATLDTGESYLWWVNDGYTELPVEQADRFNERLGRFIDGLGEKLFHLHLTDLQLPVLADQHRTPGTASTDWTRVCRHLRGVGYRGLLELEHDPRIDLEREAQEAHEHLRQAIEASAA